MLLGGDNDDILLGDDGIDQLYGGTGDDILRGGAGVTITGTGDPQNPPPAQARFSPGNAPEAFPATTGVTVHVLNGQRAYGGEGSDEIYAYAHSIDSMTESVLRGEELIGESGNDYLYGNLRRDVLAGGPGNDYIHGEYLIGPTYAKNPVADKSGGADTAYGDGGDDEIYGGGGDDVLFGGADSDRITGQDGRDYVLGGGGIDFLVLDTASNLTQFGDIFDGHFGNRTKGDVKDDNATDIIQIEGSNLPDRILLSETDVGITSRSDLSNSLVQLGRLLTNAAFTLVLDTPTLAQAPFNLPLANGTVVVNLPVTVTAASSSTNNGLDDLITDVNAALDTALTGAGLPTGSGFRPVEAVRIGNRIRIETRGLGRTTGLTFAAASLNSAATGDLNFTQTLFGVPLLDVDFNAGTEVGITSTMDVPGNGQISGDAIFTLQLLPAGEQTPVTFSVTLTQASTSTNMTIDDLADDLTAALQAAVIVSPQFASTPDILQAVRVPNTNKLRIETVGLGRDTELTLLSPNTPAQNDLRFSAGQKGQLIGRPIIRAGWRNETGQPLVEQFRIAGLGGDDEIGFATGETAVDFGSLSIRSRDWVGVIDGGSGNDILSGSNARDRLDGGRDSDLMLGNGGDDRLFGDPGNGAPNDRDVFFAGAGNDDLLGGKGTNRLYAWSFDPSGPLHFDDGQSAANSGGTATLTAFARQSRSGRLDSDVRISLSTDDLSSQTSTFFDVFLDASDSTIALNTSLEDLRMDVQAAIDAAITAAGLSTNVTVGFDAAKRMTLSTTGAGLTIRTDQFGVFVDPATGLLFNNDGDLNDDGVLDANPARPPFELEDTGLNRMLGSETAAGDRLYGGTGLDFLYGNGGADVLYTRDGLLFDAGFDVPAGQEWKAYAQATNKVWYYGGTGADDFITVDYVTEPGLLSDHHLITRLTNNNGNFSFDAQVRLDFGATDDDGNLIWDANDVVEQFTSILELDEDEQPFAFDELVLSGNLLPGEGDFLAIIIDALGGNDTVHVGPTVQKTVWVDGGAGDDVIEFESGNTILVDQTEDRNRNEVRGAELTDSSRAFGLFGPTLLIGSLAGPMNGQLSMPARVDLSFDGGVTQTRVVIPADATNASFGDLVADVNAALNSKGLSAKVVAQAVVVGAQTRLALRPTETDADVSLTVVSVNATAANELGLTDGQTVTANDIAASTRYENLTIDNPRDVDWYSFRLVNTPGANAEIRVDSAAASDRLEVVVFEQQDDGSIVSKAANNPGALTIDADLSERLLIGPRLMPETGQLDADLSFTLSVTVQPPMQPAVTTQLTVMVMAAGTSDNLDADALALSIQKVLDAAALMAKFAFVPHVLNQNGHLAFERPDDVTGLSISFTATMTETAVDVAARLGFNATQTLGDVSSSVANLFPLDRIATFAKVSGGTLHAPTDVDVFQFSLDAADVDNGGGFVTVTLSDPMAVVSVQLQDAEGTPLESRTVGNQAASVTFNLTGLAEGQYRLRIAQSSPMDANAKSTGYALTTSGQFNGTVELDLDGIGRADLLLAGIVQPGRTYFLRVRSEPDGVPGITTNGTPTIYNLTLDLDDGQAPEEFNLSRRQDLVRRDVLLGGTGNDVLRGGPSEDWIFGGAGNDVLSGGYDRQNSDLIFGGTGDDLFQILTDDLPTNPAGEPLLTTQNDRLDGGPGFDQVIFVGGDLDRLSRPVPDHVAIRFSRFLQRYEFTTLVWDAANQEFVTEPLDLRAVIAQSQVGPLNGVISAAATFELSIDGGMNFHPVTVPRDAENVNLLNLAADINTALAGITVGGGKLSDHVVAEVTVDGLQFATTAFGVAAQLELRMENPVTTNELFLKPTQARGDAVLAFKQRFAYYQALNMEGTRIETRGGDDEVHADPEYRFPLANANGFLDSEWGIKRGNAQEGATIGALVIDGGDGNDRLFGGYLDDSIFGGDGADFIAGYEGNDKLDGGPGRDLILGEHGVAMDRFEANTRDAATAIGDETGFNDSLLFSAIANVIDPSDLNDDVLAGLTFNVGDAGDWYLIPTPPARNTFGNADRAVLSRGDIKVVFDQPDDQALFTLTEPHPFLPNETVSVWHSGAVPQNVNDSKLTFYDNYSLFAAVQTDPQGELAFLPVEQFSGVPEYYLLHVNNVKSYGVRGIATPNTDNITAADGMSAISVATKLLLTVDGVTSNVLSVTLNTGDPLTAMNTAASVLGKLQIAIADAGLSDRVFAYLDQTKAYLVVSLRTPGELSIHATGDAFEQQNFARLGFETGQSNRGAVDPMSSYAVTFDAGIGDVIDVPASAGDVQLKSSFPSDKAVLIPLGDFNGDGQGDFIASARDVLATASDREATPATAHPHQIVGPSFARIHLGGVNEIAQADGTSNVALGAGTLTLQLPAPLLSASFGLQSHIAAGDFNGDGLSDIAVLVSTDRFVLKPPRPAHSADGLYVLYGRSDFSAVTGANGAIDITRAADVIFTNVTTTFGFVTSFVSPGDAIGTGGFADLLIGRIGSSSNGDVLLLAGAAQTSAPWSDSGVLFREDFSNGLGGFVTDNQPLDSTLQRLAPVDGLWHVTTTGRTADRLHTSSSSVYFGRQETATGGGNFGVGDTAGHLTRTFTIPSSGPGAHPVRNPELSFNSLLETEAAMGAADVAEVFVSVNGGMFQLVADNSQLGPANLNDFGYAPGTGKDWFHERISLTAVVGTLLPGDSISVRFAFDAIDAANLNSNVPNPEGWYIDDVELRGATDLSALAAPEVTRFSTPGGAPQVAATGSADWDNDSDHRDGFLVAEGGAMFPTNVYLFEGRDTFAATNDLTFSTPATPSPADRVLQISGANNLLPTFVVAGDLDGDGNGDLFAQYTGFDFGMLVATPPRTTIIYSGNPTDSVFDVAGTLIPLGNLDGSVNGVADVARVRTERSDRLAEDGTELIHDVFHVFLDPSQGPRTMAVWNGLVNGTTPAVAVVEPGRSFFRSATSTTAPRAGGLVALGDLNGDGTDDVGLIDALGSGTHVFFGQPPAAVTFSTTSSLDAEEFVFEMTTPRLDIDRPRTGLDVNEPTPHDILTAFRIEGRFEREQFSGTQSIGDFNNDGYADLLLTGDRFAYVLLGPPRLDGIDDVGPRSEIRIDLSGGWKPAVHRGGFGEGDVDGDRTDDLFFYRNRFVPGLGTFFDVSVLPGTTRPVRDYSVSQDGTTIVSLSASGGVIGLNSSAHLLNYDDDDDFVDLFVGGDIPTPGGRAGLVFVGRRSDINSEHDLESVLNMQNGAIPARNATHAAADITYTLPSNQGSPGSTEVAQLKTQFLGSRADDYDNGTLTSRLNAAIVDLDADGRDDIVFVNPVEVAFSPRGTAPLLNLESVYVFEPQAVASNSGTVPVTLNAGAALVRGITQSIFPFTNDTRPVGLGDVNRDGFGDFGLQRGYEANSFGEASLLVFYGGADRVPGGGLPVPVLTPDDADVAVRQFEQDALPAGTLLIGSAASVTSGDFDNDRRVDVAIGQPVSLVVEAVPGQLPELVDLLDRGRIDIVWNVAHLGREIVLDPAPRDINGDGRTDVLRLNAAFAGDGFGTLAKTNGIDADLDGYDDLFIGAAQADALRAEVIDRAGAIYAVYGSPRRIALPDESVVNVVELANRTFTGIGDVIVDTGTGRPAEFSNLDENGVPFTTDFAVPAATMSNPLPESWYRFRTVGDGKPGDDVLRLLPFRYDDQVVTLGRVGGHQDPSGAIVDLGPYTVGGIGDREGVVEVDLSSLLEAYENDSAVAKVELVLDVVAGVQPIILPQEIVAAGSRFFFNALTNETGRELFVSNGTAAGTRLVVDLAEGASSDPRNLTAVGSDVFFTLIDDNLPQLWYSDGTAVGTTRVDFGVGFVPETITNLTAFQGRLFFVASKNGGSDTQLFGTTTDGMGNFDADAISPLFTGGETIPHLAVLDATRLFFTVNANEDEYELHVTDGTPAGTQLLHTFQADSTFGRPLQDFGILNGEIYFGASEVFGPNDHGVELWRSNGTTGGTVEVANINTSFFAADSGPRGFAFARHPLTGDRLFFIAGSASSPTFEVWTTNGTTTSKVADISDQNGQPRDVQAVSTGTRVFTAVHNGQATTLSLIDFMTNGTPVVTNFQSVGSSTEIRNLTALGNNAAFVSETASASSLSLTDGRVTRGTFPLATSTDPNEIDLLAGFNGQLLFRAEESQNGQQAVFITDGQPVNTLPVLDVGTVTATLTVQRLPGEGDGVVTGRDFELTGLAAGSAQVTTASGQQTIVVDVTNEVRAALADRRRQLTLRFDVSDPALRLSVSQPDPTRGADPTGLRVTRRPGVRADVLDVNGGVIEESIAAIDMRNLPAGTYYLRVFSLPGADLLPDPNDTTPPGPAVPVSFAIQIDAPIQGFARAGLDNDVIEGGEGEDILVGNEHLDRLFGESGDDTFLAEAVEVRDLDAEDETVRPVDASDALVSNPPKIFDPVIAIPDELLRRALSGPLNVPLLGNGQFALDVRATDLARLPYVDASGREIQDLSGLEYAINLAGLNLSSNDLQDLSKLNPGLSEGGAVIAPQFIGPRLLRWLNADRNPVQNLDPLALLTELRMLSLTDTIERSEAGLLGTFFVTRDGASIDAGVFNSFPDVNKFRAVDNPNIGPSPDTLVEPDLDLSGINATQDYIAVYEGQIFIQNGGRYTFRLISTDGSRLFIDDQSVVNSGVVAPTPDLHGIDLTPGYHNIRVEFFQQSANVGQLRLDWRAPGEGLFLLVPGSVLRTRPLTDVSGLVGLPKNDLVYVDLSNNALIDVSPLAKLPSLKVLDLSNNEIVDISALAGAFVIDDGEAGYAEPGAAAWQRNQSLITTAFEGDYRRQVTGNGVGAAGVGVAEWTFSDLLGAPYDVFATWHPDEGQATNAFFVVDGAGDAVEFSVNQRFDPNPAPNGLTLGGRPFAFLKQVSPDAMTGEIKVRLSDQSLPDAMMQTTGSDGTVTADAIVLRTSNAPLPKLLRLDVHHNPLGEDAFDLSLPTLDTRQTALNMNFELLFDANNAPQISGAIGPQHSSGSSSRITLPGVVNQLLPSDSNRNWLTVGVGDSAEVLRFGGPTVTSVSRVFAASGLPVAIPDLATATAGITVSQLPGVLLDVNVSLSMTHTFDADLDVFLIGPDGTRVELFTDVGGNGDNFSNTTLDDEAATLITAGAAPFSGLFRPEGSLAAFDGGFANGTWTLEVIDDFGGDVGQITQFGLSLLVQPPIPVAPVVDPAPGEFAEVFTQTKSPGSTGSSSLSGGVYGPDGHLYVTDASNRTLTKYDGATGQVLASHTFSEEFRPQDVVVRPSNGTIYVAGYAFIPSIFFQGRVASVSTDFNTVNESFISGPGYTGLFSFSRQASLDFGADSNLYVAWSNLSSNLFVDLNLTATGNVQRFNLNLGQLTDLIPTSDPNLAAPVDIAVSDTGMIYLVDRFIDGNGDINDRVVQFNDTGTASFQGERIAPRGADQLRRDRRPRIEIGPDDRLYLSDPVSGLVEQRDRTNGLLLNGTFANPPASDAPYVSFLAFAQNRPFVFDVTTSDPSVTGEILPNGDLQLATPGVFNSPVEVTIRVGDGPNASHDWNGRFSETTFDFHIGVNTLGQPPAVNAVYGTVFDDVDEDGAQDPGERSLENVLVFFDANGNSRFDDASSVMPDPFVRTDANGAYSFSGLPSGVLTFAAAPDGNLSDVVASSTIGLSNELVTGADLALFEELDAGPDLGGPSSPVSEGDAINLTASVRRPGFAVPLVNIVPDIAGPGSSNPSGFTEFNGDLYFAASTPFEGTELFRFDGSTATLVADIFPGSASSLPTDLTAFNGLLYFAAFDGNGDHELFSYDGVNPPVNLDINPGGSSAPRHLTVYNNRLYFNTGNNPTGARLTSFDGTTASTITVIEPPGTYNPSELIVFGPDLYFRSEQSAEIGRELYRYDGTNTTLVADIDPSAAHSDPSDFAVFGGSLFFSATNTTINRELFSFDGMSITSFDIDGTGGSSDPQQLTVAGGELYFSAGSGDGTQDRELYAFNAGTPQRIEINSAPSVGSNPADLAALGGDVFFAATDVAGDRELWRVRGTTPLRVANIAPAGSSNPEGLTAIGGELIFAADDGNIGIEPWRFVPADNVTYAWQVSGMPVGSPTGETTPNFSFIPQNEGRFTASVTIDVPGTSLRFADVVDIFAAAVAPTIDAGMSESLSEGSMLSRNLTIVDPGSDTWTVTVDYGDGQPGDTFVPMTTRGFALNRIYKTPGLFPVTVTVNSNEGTASDSFNVTVGNVQPQVVLSPGGAVNEGANSTLTIDITDPTGNFLKYQLLQVNWGDGADGGQDVVELFSGVLNITGATTAQAVLTHTYADNRPGNAVYPVAVTVRGDDHGSLDAMNQPIDDQTVAMTTLTVNNIAPVINLGLTSVPMSLFENQLGMFSGVATDNDPVTYSWDFGEGGLQAPGQVLLKAYADNQATPFTVTLFVRDDENAVSQQTFQVTINNVAPVVTPIGNQTIGEGSALVLTDIGTFVDPGLNDGQFMFTINWGDGTSDGPLAATIDQAATLATALSAGSPAMGSFDGLHVYSDDGPQVVTLTVTDKDGAVSSQEQFLVIVTNVAPTVTAAPTLPMTILENQQFSISVPIATFTDPEFGNNPQFTYSIDWGDGTQPDTGTAAIDALGSSGVLTTGSIPNTQMHTYADDGTYTVEVSITDENGMGSTNSDSFQIVVANVDPMLIANTPTGPIVGGQLVTLNGLFGDVPNDTVEVTLDFGDNIQRRALLNNGAFQLPHVFQNAGPQTVQVVAKDEDQGQTIQMLNLNIVLPDVVVQSATLNGTTASVTYDILNADLSQLVLGFFRSPDELFNPASGPAPDTQLDQVLLTNALDLTIGTHIKTFNIGTSAADLSLPGVGRSEDDSDYHLLVVADPTDAIFEDDVVNMANPLGMYREDNTAVISGVYQVLVAPATTASVFIHGTLGNDTVTAQAGGLAIDFNGVMHNFAMGTVADIRARAHGGDDALDLMTIMQSAFVLGADGIDMIWGTNADDVLFGGNGNDFLLGNLGDDELHGDAGDDDLMGSGGNDDIHPGLGNDMAKGQGGSGDVLFANVAGLATLVNTSLTQPTETDTLDMFERAELTGGSGNDTIDASMFTVGPVKLDGAAGDDVLLGTTFNDELIGGPTANVGDLDEIRQTTGVNQTLTNTSVTGQGTDVLTNIDRAMLLISGSSDVTIDSTGFSGDVTAFGGNGNDKIFLGPGNDFAIGSAGDDEIHGGSGNDSLNGAAGRDMLFGDAGNDVLKGQGASDTLGGGLGDDVIDGGGSSDMLFDGGDANLTLTNSSLIGIGTDTLISIDKAHIYGGPSPNTLDASAFVSFELTVIDGAGGGDILFGTNGFDVLTSTGNGNDMMVANGGDDFVFAGSGKDTIFGGAGDDRLFGQGGSGDLIFGGPGKDSISGGTGDDILSGGDGNDLIFGDAGNDIMNGGAGNDNLFGNDGNDGQSGYTGNDFIVGGAGNDLLVGHDGDDILQGEAGLDTLVGGGGTSIEGDGPDMLDGGLDADQIDGLQSEIVNSDPLDTIAAFMNFPSWVDLI